MKVDHSKYVDVRWTTLEKQFVQNLLTFIQSLDVIQLIYGVGKVNVIMKIEAKNEVLEMLDDTCQFVTVSEDWEDSVVKFIQFVCYSWRESESLVESFNKTFTLQPK